ncbi:hypothetical protein SDC9_64069 [bioreactor metagenome]|uniref:Uncharacterized protein n=1 Tax=bioreactor metagenome TaxID=1076179 RepID=A0A644XNA2_9ZZZZ
MRPFGASGADHDLTDAELAERPECAARGRAVSDHHRRGGRLDAGPAQGGDQSCDIGVVDAVRGAVASEDDGVARLQCFRDRIGDPVRQQRLLVGRGHRQPHPFGSERSDEITERVRCHLERVVAELVGDAQAGIGGAVQQRRQRMCDRAADHGASAHR